LLYQPKCSYQLIIVHDFGTRGSRRLRIRATPPTASLYNAAWLDLQACFAWGWLAVADGEFVPLLAVRMDILDQCLAARWTVENVVRMCMTKHTWPCWARGNGDGNGNQNFDGRDGEDVVMS
jgi:hypothetical protein